MDFKSTYITHTNCITPLGFDVESNLTSIAAGISGIERHEDSRLMASSFYAGAIQDDAIERAFAAISADKNYTRLEKMMILALYPVVKDSGVVFTKKTGLLIATTKGNISALTGITPPDSAYLAQLAQNVGDFFNFIAQPVVVSNACVSGILAVSVAKRLIQSGMYSEVFVVSGDELSEFVLSGFNVFQAMSDAPCRPYSANRSGVSLGEAAAAALVTTDAKAAKAKITGDASVNDANHISGPSRTGEGLVRSLVNAMNEAGVGPNEIDYISAHGTATPFNDEMEAVAFSRTGLTDVPVNSFKGYYGHTLGASGLLETVIGIECMLHNKLFKSLGYDSHGVSEPINVISENRECTINRFIKTASGFGGCNTAVVFEKIHHGDR